MIFAQHAKIEGELVDSTQADVKVDGGSVHPQLGAAQVFAVEGGNVGNDAVGLVARELLVLWRWRQPVVLPVSEQKQPEAHRVAIGWSRVATDGT